MLATRKISYDPLVGDTACHTRATYLVYLFRKEKIDKLSTEEENYLKACEVLTQAQYRKLDAFGVIIEEKTQISELSHDLLGQPLKTSNAAKNKFLGLLRNQVAQDSLTFLFEACKGMEYDADPVEFTYNLKFLGHDIPVLPLPVSAKMMLYFASKAAIPLMVNLKRLKRVDRDFLLDGAVSLAYFYNSDLGKFIPQEVKEDQEAIAIDMVSCQVEDPTSTDLTGLLASGTFKAFLEVFQREDLATLVMLCAVVHPEYPKNAKPKVNKSSRKLSVPDSTSEEKSVSSDKLEISLKRCSKKENEALRLLAPKYGFFSEMPPYSRLEQETKKVIRTKTNLPFFIDHVYASTISACQATTANLMRQRDSLKEPQEAVLEDEVVMRKNYD